MVKLMNKKKLILLLFTLKIIKFDSKNFAITKFDSFLISRVKWRHLPFKYIFHIYLYFISI